MSKKHVTMTLSHDAIYPSIDIRVIKEAKSLLKYGFKVTIVCRMSTTDWPIRDEYEGINIVRVFCPHPPLGKNRLLRLLYNFNNVRKLAKSVIKLNPDIIHCHDLNSLLEGVIAKIKLKVPLVYDTHEIWPLLEYSKSGNSKLVYLVTTIYEQILLSFVSYEIRAVAHQKPLLPPNRSILLLNCPTLDFIDEANPEPIRKKYRLHDKVVIIYHGVVGVNKGIVEMINSAEKLVKKYKNLKFFVVGHNYEPFLEMVKKKSLDKYFIFTGRVQYSEIPSYLKASDIGFIIHRPIKQYIYGTPNKLYEGMAAELAFIGNAEFPGMNEVITKNRIGVTVNCDVNEIVGGFEELINDKSLRKRFGKNARAAMERKYNWEYQEKRLLKIYKKNG